MKEDEEKARKAITASAEAVGAEVINLALFDRVGGFDALLLCRLNREEPHVAKYVTWRSHWLASEKALPGVYWGSYSLDRREADQDYNKRYEHVSSISSCFVPVGDKR